MKNVLADETTLHGKLIGIGKIKKDGTEEFKWLDKPIHNTIVNQGIDYLFTANGTNYVDFYGSYSYNVGDMSTMFATGNYYSGGNYGDSPAGYRYGCLDYMAYGTGNTPTQETDTDLENKTSEYSNTKKTGTPMCGTYEVTYGKYKMRISHISSVANADTIVNEIGWYGRYGTTRLGETTNIYKMFSRVVLEQPFDLYEGEQLITTYELVLTFDHIQEEEIEFFGLTDVDGVTPLKAQVKRIIARSNNDDDYSSMATREEWKYSFPNITTLGRSVIYGCRSNGHETAQSYDYAPRTLPPCVRNFTNYHNSYWWSLRPYFSLTDKEFPAEYSQEPANSSNYDTSSSQATITFKNYTSGSFEREIIVSMGQYYPNNTPLEGYTDIHYINFNGMAYRFGYYTDEINPETGESEKVWHPQALRKYGNKILKLTFRTTLSPSNTTGQAEVDSQEP